MPISATKSPSAARNRLLAAGGVAAAALTLTCAVVPAAEAAPAVAHTTASHSSAGAPGSLDGWINQALSIMKKHGIPGSYSGVYRNVMRESSGNPAAVNNTDSNAAAGTPSKGLLQVIQPTFSSFHVAGTSSNINDPVANIVAACNYAAHRYGSIDPVNSAY